MKSIESSLGRKTTAANILSNLTGNLSGQVLGAGAIENIVQNDPGTVGDLTQLLALGQTGATLAAGA